MVRDTHFSCGGMDLNYEGHFVLLFFFFLAPFLSLVIALWLLWPILGPMAKQCLLEKCHKHNWIIGENVWPTVWAVNLIKIFQICKFLIAMLIRMIVFQCQTAVWRPTIWWKKGFVWTWFSPSWKWPTSHIFHTKHSLGHCDTGIHRSQSISNCCPHAHICLLISEFP